MVDRVDYLDDEEGVFADRVIVFQRDYDVFLRGVGGDFAEAAGGALNIGRGIFRGGHVGANTWGVEGDGNVHPLFSGVDGMAAGVEIGVVEALPNVGGDIRDVCVCFLQGFAEGFEIGGVGGLEVLCERLDIVDAELSDDFGWELQESHAGKFVVAIAVIGCVDISAKRVGGDGDAVARGSGEFDVRAGLARYEDRRRSVRYDSACGEGREFFEKSSTG